MKEITVWGLVLIISIFMGIALALGLRSRIKSRYLVHQGITVNVDVIRVAESHLGRRRFYYLHFMYQGKDHSIQVSPSYLARIKSLRTAKLLHLSKYSDLFVEPSYDDGGQLLSGSVLVLFFIFTAGFSLVRILQNGSTLRAR